MSIEDEFEQMHQALYKINDATLEDDSIGEAMRAEIIKAREFLGESLMRLEEESKQRSYANAPEWTGIEYVMELRKRMANHEVLVMDPRSRYVVSDININVRHDGYINMRLHFHGKNPHVEYFRLSDLPDKIRVIEVE